MSADAVSSLGLTTDSSSSGGVSYSSGEPSYPTKRNIKELNSILSPEALPFMNSQAGAANSIFG